MAEEVDGVMTLWEDAVVVTAATAKLLGKTANEPSAHAMAKNKSRPR